MSKRTDGMTQYEKACYLLAIYRGSLVVFDGRKNQDDQTIARLVETMAVGQETVLGLWEREQTWAYEAVIEMTIKEIGYNAFLADVVQFLSTVRAGSEVF